MPGSETVLAGCAGRPGPWFGPGPGLAPRAGLANESGDAPRRKGAARPPFAPRMAALQQHAGRPIMTRRGEVQGPRPMPASYPATDRAAFHRRHEARAARVMRGYDDRHNGLHRRYASLLNVAMGLIPCFMGRFRSAIATAAAKTPPPMAWSLRENTDQAGLLRLEHSRSVVSESVPRRYDRSN